MAVLAAGGWRDGKGSGERAPRPTMNRVVLVHAAVVMADRCQTNEELSMPPAGWLPPMLRDMPGQRTRHVLPSVYCHYMAHFSRKPKTDGRLHGKRLLANRRQRP